MTLMSVNKVISLIKVTGGEKIVVRVAVARLGADNQLGHNLSILLFFLNVYSNPLFIFKSI